MGTIIKHKVRGKVKNTTSFAKEMIVDNQRGVFIPLLDNIDVADIKEIKSSNIIPMIKPADPDAGYLVLFKNLDKCKFLIIDILYILVVGNYIYIYERGKDKKDFRMTLKAVQNMLPADMFWLASRFGLVNLFEIKEWDMKRGSLIKMSDDGLVEVGRTCLESLSDLHKLR